MRLDIAPPRFTKFFDASGKIAELLLSLTAGSPMKLITVIFSICIFAGIVLGQSGYSEYKPYKPEGNAKLEANEVKAQAATPQEVVIPVSVLDKSGMPVTDLTKVNFTVLLDRVETPVTSFEKTGDLP